MHAAMPQLKLDLDAVFAVASCLCALLYVSLVVGALGLTTEVTPTRDRNTTAKHPTKQHSQCRPESCCNGRLLELHAADLAEVTNS